MGKGLIISLGATLCVTILVFLAYFLSLSESVMQETLFLAIFIGMILIIFSLACALTFGMVLVTERGRPAPLGVEGELLFITPSSRAKRGWLLLIREEEDQITKGGHRLSWIPKGFLDDQALDPQGRNFVKIIEEDGWRRAKIVPLTEESDTSGSEIGTVPDLDG